MSEYIGSRISLISKSDIRYVGTLVEINSENSTVALEKVMSYGTEDRRTGADSFPPSASLYDYILFRGSDVKDLRIEEAPKEASPPNPPQMPNDPAILGSARPANSTPTQHPSQPSPKGPPQGPLQGPPPNQQGPPGHQNFPPHPQFNQFGPYGGMPPQGFGRGFPPGPGGPGFPPGYPGPGMHFGPGGPGGPPPGWYGPPGPQGFPPFGPGGMPQGPPGLAGKGPVQHPNKDQRPVEKDTDTRTPEPIAAAKPPVGVQKDVSAPPPPVDSKPDVAAALAPPTVSKATSNPKGRPQPAIPLSNQRSAASGAGNAPGSAQASMGNISSQTTAQQAAAAVAAAMAKLPRAGGASGFPQSQNNGVDNLTHKLNEMRTNDGGRGRGTRGGMRGRGRGGYQKVEIPTTDFDFESANKKFNKEDVAKEAQVGSPEPTSLDGAEIAEATNDGGDDVVIPPAAYNKASSFFDNISSELKDREEKRVYGGVEFRHEERRKNVETFGQGSIDGYRGGFRGRGRGRGRGQQGQGRGMGSGFGRGRGASRGGGGIES